MKKTRADWLANHIENIGGFTVVSIVKMGKGDRHAVNVLDTERGYRLQITDPSQWKEYFEQVEECKF